ncbi:39S ribosomal protein L18, mitochondrial [Contarinia nasturtii]|uniref:39S ribosomal protein L18, mitochondrial n=1 Tax=Contarinia nasturtii TaxID=265458 RepID=UPI0012D39684|nr:39S ribosomal protein L18, mitochondrial [Contarinia nasturtii]
MIKKKVPNCKLYKMLMECRKPAENAIYMQNRNPRNLEMMKIAQRPDGYLLDMPGRCFWNKLVLEKTTKGLTASVQHYTGRTVLESSTEEWSLSKHLYRPYDMAAYVNFGRIFARRCLEAGIIEVANYNEAPEGSKLGRFIKELENNGLKLSESPQYKKHYAAYTFRMDKPWMIQNE